MRLKIASRKSDLARIQAQMVASLLRDQFSDLTIEHLYSTSFGDQNPDIPLWQMPEKGAFTEDFRDGLAAGDFHMVVHSWKDLPTDLPETSQLFTIKRADPRDLILFKKDCLKAKKLKILTSSPRRQHHLDDFITNFFPGEISDLEVLPIRGNIPTRLSKYLEGEAHSIVVAKAALDRILQTTSDEFKELREIVLNTIAQSLWMIPPLSHFPTAPAQGALAIEVLKGNNDIIDLVTKIHDPLTFEHVNKERDILKSYGGGCHQKIGITSIEFERGHYFNLSGETPEKEIIKEITFKREETMKWEGPKTKDQLFPLELDTHRFFHRKDLPVDSLDNKDLWVTRFHDSEQLNTITSDQLVWSAGTKTWMQLAKKGIWCSGSNEALGEGWDERVESLINRKPNWHYLTHNKAPERASNIPYYELVPQEKTPDLTGRQYFFWMSGTQFLAALEKNPEITNAFHSSGPGRTHDLLKQYISPDHLHIFLNYQHWLTHMELKIKDQ